MTNINNIDTLVFDYGAVIVDLNVQTVRKALANLGISRWQQWWHRKKCRRIMHDFTNGLLPEKEVLSELLPYCRRGTTYQQLLEAVCLVCEPLSKDRLDTIAALHKTYHIYLLSNINETLWNDAVKDIQSVGYQINDLFDNVFLSYELQCAKPDSSIYQHIIETTGLTPSRTLYFDDREENIIAGNNAQFQAIQIDFNKIESNKIYQELIASNMK